uniref:HNH endonuclease n=1 Tax=candidate division CPR3 bacterium TaxID=2268181 RepID=A0A7C5UR65_UNCC3
MAWGKTTYQAPNEMRESLLSIIRDISPNEDNYFVSNLDKGSPALQTYHEWNIFHEDRVTSVTAKAEGADTSYTDLQAESRAGNYTVIVDSPVRLSRTKASIAMVTKQDALGVEKERALRRLKNKMEYLLVNGSLAAGATDTARGMAGIDAFITSKKVGGVSIPKTHKCFNCGKEFRHRSGKKHQFNKFCSRECSAKYSGKILEKENSPHWKKEMIRVKKCLNCGVEIRNVPLKDILIEKQKHSDVVFTSRAITEFQKQKFCSMECSIKARVYKKGKNHPNWRGGKSELRNTLSVNSKYKEWRKAIFERDNYTCQMCGKRGGLLQADHIKPFALIVRENGIKDVEDALKCKELWDINNGRTLCINCHRKTFIFLGNQFKGVDIENWVNSVKPRTGNTEPSQEIADRLLEGVETRLNKYNATAPIRKERYSPTPIGI